MHIAMDVNIANNNKVKDEKDTPANFEQAIDAAGFGTFNFILLLTAIPSIYANVFETTTMSYILPIAECDLKLTLIDKGVLNAATYAGMITSAIVWGFLADTRGRKIILVCGYLANSIFVFGSSLSQNFQMLVISKFLSGLIVNGPGAVLFTYLTEMHGNKHRPRVLMVLGMITTSATLVLPLLALGIFPRDWNFILFGRLNVHSWQIFLAVCSLPSLISGLLFMILPESPKFLMSQGRNSDALYAFQKIYAFNTRKPKTTYPITQLVEEIPNRDIIVDKVIYTIENEMEEGGAHKVNSRTHRSILQAFRDGMQQIKPMFRKPLLGHSIHVCTMQFCILLGLNTIRLWLPQLFASIAEYEAFESSTEASSNLCSILEYSVNKTVSQTSSLDAAPTCDMQRELSFDVYTNNIIVGATGFIGFFFAGIIIKAIGAKRMLSYGLLISGTFGLGLYWSNIGIPTLIISSIFVTLASISRSSLLGVVLELFPTSFRSLVVCIAMMFGRFGALSGNMLFPVLVQIGCIPPFLMVGFVMFFAGVLSCILPSKKKSTFK